MCGIIAVRKFDGTQVDEALLVRMRDTMTHRGPDDAGCYASGPVGLGHRRLSILDLSPKGHQPMCNEDGSVWLTFNGEIYNYVELKQDLIGQGHTFRSTTDSEVIIHLYEELGERCVERLNGMFGFVIWDSRHDVLFGARDRFGIKPLYYYADGRQFVCASEIKAIVEDSAVPRVADNRGIADFLFAGAPLAGKTFFRDVSQLPPGHTLRVERGQVSVKPYWDLLFSYDLSRSDAAVAAETAELVNDAVRIHCRSDVALGSHLSGGLDSSTVSAYASQHVEGLKTFSIRFDATEERYDETRFARLVAEAVGSEFVGTTASGASLARLFPSLLWHMDQPASGGGDAGFSYFAASELASAHVKVGLTGHGGDELFAGYPAQFQTAFGSTSSFEGLSAPRPPSIGRLARLKRVLRGEGIGGALRRIASRAGGGTKEASPEELWTRLHCGPPPERNLALNKGFVSGLGGYSPLNDYLEPFRNAPTDHLLDRCLYHDLRVYLPQLLHKEDRASMSVSIESRVPLLDPRIAEFLATLSPEQKVPDRVPKALLRGAASRHIPEEVWQRRDKVPFAIPMGTWMTGVLSPLVDRLLGSDECLDRGVFNPDLIRDGALKDKERLAILNVELWFRVFIDRQPEWLSMTDEITTSRASAT